MAAVSAGSGEAGDQVGVQVPPGSPPPPGKLRLQHLHQPYVHPAVLQNGSSCWGRGRLQQDGWRRHTPRCRHHAAALTAGGAAADDHNVLDVAAIVGAICAVCPHHQAPQGGPIAGKAPWCPLLCGRLRSAAAHMAMSKGQGGRPERPPLGGGPRLDCCRWSAPCDCHNASPTEVWVSIGCNALQLGCRRAF